MGIAFAWSGCGHGDDLAGLAAHGIPCDGFDPTFRPDAAKTASLVVNLGFGLNVIENASERADVLRDAWELAQQVLCVAAWIVVSDSSGGDVEYGDGVLTWIGTFQEYFTQAEFRQYIEETLGVEGFPAAPGVFYVFRDEDLKATYLASKYRRRIAAPRKRIAEIRYEEHRGILDSLLELITELGRLPEADEFASADAVMEAVGSLKRAFALIRQVTSEEDWASVRRLRSEDLLVYLALANFGKRPKLSDLSRKVRRDVRAFFGSYKAACAKADARSQVLAWEHTATEAPASRALAHGRRSLQDIACLGGSLGTRVWLRTLRVEFYETVGRVHPPLLDQKDRMLDAEDERRGKFERLSRRNRTPAPFRHWCLTALVGTGVGSGPRRELDQRAATSLPFADSLDAFACGPPLSDAPPADTLGPIRDATPSNDPAKAIPSSSGHPTLVATHHSNTH